MRRRTSTSYGRKFEELYLNYERLSDEGKVHGQKVEALDLWKKMLSMIFETGHPWITFKEIPRIVFVRRRTMSEPCMKGSFLW